MSGQIAVQYYYSPIGVAVSCLTAGTEMVSFGQNDTWGTVMERARTIAAARGRIIADNALMATRSANSTSFDRLSAQSADWSKLPDWPEWSRQMASVPL